MPSLNDVAIIMGQLIFHQLILLSVFMYTKFCLFLILQAYADSIPMTCLNHTSSGNLRSFLWMMLFLIMLNLEGKPDESIGSRAHPVTMLGGWLTLYWFDVNFPSADVWHVTPSDMEEVMRFSMLPRIQCSGDEKCKGLDNCYWSDDLKDGLHGWRTLGASHEQWPVSIWRLHFQA